MAAVGGGVALALTLIGAHAGHWFEGLLYVAPVAIVVGFLAVQSRKERRLQEEEAELAKPGGEG